MMLSDEVGIELANEHRMSTQKPEPGGTLGGGEILPDARARLVRRERIKSHFNSV